MAGSDFSGANLQGANFSKAILRNANFRAADIRGCNFTQAILTDANFEEVKTGTSDKQLISLLCTSFGFATLIGFAIAESGSTGDVAIDSTKYSQTIGSLIIATLMSVAIASLFLYAMNRAWYYDNKISIITASIAVLVCLCAAVYGVRQTVVILFKASNTRFCKANLTGAKFNRAVIQNTDFSNAILADVDLTDAVGELPLPEKPSN